MEDATAVGVLHCRAALEEDVDTLPQREPALVAVVRDRQTAHQLDGEERATLACGPGTQHFGEVRMIEK
jgi:hypothetical protein